MALSILSWTMRIYREANIKHYCVWIYEIHSDCYILVSHLLSTGMTKWMVWCHSLFSWRIVTIDKHKWNGITQSYPILFISVLHVHHSHLFIPTLLPASHICLLVSPRRWMRWGALKPGLWNVSHQANPSCWGTTSFWYNGAQCKKYAKMQQTLYCMWIVVYSLARSLHMPAMFPIFGACGSRCFRQHWHSVMMLL